MIRKILALTVIAFAAIVGTALANAPNPTSIVVNGYSVSGGKTTITVSGTWAWGANVPSGGQKDCNDTRIGVGYSVSWGDNTANEIPGKGGLPNVYVGDAQDNWVHSVTQGANQVVDGPFKTGGTVTENMTGQTLDAFTNGLGAQGISNTSTGAGADATPLADDAANWFSNCGPTAQSTVNGQTIGNSNPANPTQGYPAGTWGPISHTYTSSGPYTICPVMYDPHGSQVGDAAGSPTKDPDATGGSANQITAGGSSRNTDNSVEGNGNSSVCPLNVVIPKLTTSATPASATTGVTISDAGTIQGSSPKGTITWKLYGPFASAAAVSCSGTPVYTSAPVTVNGNGTYSPAATSVSQAGIYQWVASYTSSDSTNLSVSDIGCGDSSEQVNVTSPPVTPPPPPPSTPPTNSFTSVKEQKLAGQPDSAYTTAPITATVGQVVDYEIVVKNTGDQDLALALSDPHCDAGTVAGPFGGLDLDGDVLPGQTTVYTCEHTLAATDAPAFTNTAVVTGTPPGGAPIVGPPLSVVANIPTQGVAACVASTASLKVVKHTGTAFVVRISGKNITRVVFKLDGRTIKTLTKANVKGGSYQVTIDPAKSSYGAHRLTVTASESCGPAQTRAARFSRVVPRRQVTPKFTG